MLSVVLATIKQSKVRIFHSSGWYLSNVAITIQSSERLLCWPKRSSNIIRIFENEVQIWKKAEYKQDWAYQTAQT